jgi:hypothetical protein
MTRRSVEAIVLALEQAGVRYLIAGGLAVVAHGHVRFTADVDLLLDPEPANLARAVEALRALGYGPRAPVALEAFLDPGERARWNREKGMLVFSLASAQHSATEVDLFLEPPLEFGPAWQRAVLMDIGSGVRARFVSLADLAGHEASRGTVRGPARPGSAREAPPGGSRVSDPRDERIWERGWDGHRDAQARRMAALSLAEKLDWLEEAHALVMNLRRASLVREGDGGSTPEPGR